MGKIRLWALYLPQYHPIKEIFNKVVDIGFTEMGDEDDYIYYDYDAYLSLPSRREIEMKLEEVGFKDIKSLR